eukprot:TRINITY_DN5799_c0_g1_i1.p1 TRINITY_DN5799_c0_g1~~TRINITY_DN5799_c0_g1_i1.p1  ORF type:complete len:334 (-),score=84.46 TRINITY_DN5799_c0_g1_i1:58-1059(-)
MKIQQISRSLKSKRCYSTSNKNPRILMTGSLGQIGTELSALLRKQYGSNNVIVTDVKKAPEHIIEQGPYRYLDVTDKKSISKMVVDERIDWVLHLSSILSATGERNMELAMKINIDGIQNVLEVAKDHQLRVYAPSSIAAFGGGTPLENTPDIVPMRPGTIYGVSKVYLELLGEYYHKKFGVDFRSLRYPGIISSETLPGGGTTDYAVDIYIQALQKKKYTCYIQENCALPMMYMPDCLDATIKFIQADNANLTQRTYNVAAISFNPAQVAAEIKKHIPSFEIDYKIDFRNDIAWSWPRALNDSTARRDWNWNHKYGLEEMTKDMLEKLSKNM